MQDPNKKLVIVSACLAGLASRYDGRIISCPDCLKKLGDVHWIPLCPEQLGGLPTPRPAAQIVGGEGADVLAGSAQVLCVDDGRDLTRPFIDGAHQVLDIARRTAYLKSPYRCYRAVAAHELCSGKGHLFATVFLMSL
jgi:uncharacterized protein YbbK (DUF523 family)